MIIMKNRERTIMKKLFLFLQIILLSIYMTGCGEVKSDTSAPPPLSSSQAVTTPSPVAPQKETSNNNFVDLPNTNTHPGSHFIRVYTIDNPNYYKYINGRYAYSLSIPASFSIVFQPDNSDGCSFSLPDKSSKLSVYGSHNTSSDTIDSVFTRDISHIGVNSTKFIDHGDNWFVISWIKNDKIFYRKTFVSNEYINTMELSYPITQKDAFNDIVSTIEESFIPGWKTGYRILG
jgi:hypothetical protein